MVLIFGWHVLVCFIFQNFSQPSRFAGLMDDQEEAAEKAGQGKIETEVAKES